MATYLVTGANRGLGLELVRQLAHLDTGKVSRVFAFARSKSQPLDEIIANSSGRVIAVNCEVTNQESVEAAVEKVKNNSPNGLDVLVNNVGTMSFYPEGIHSMPADALVDTFRTNVASVHLVSAALIPLLEVGRLKKIVNISTSLGSLTQASKYAGSPAPSYKLTKAALNMLGVQYALEYGPKGFTVLSISPGVNHRKHKSAVL